MHNLAINTFEAVEEAAARARARARAHPAASINRKPISVQNPIGLGCDGDAMLPQILDPGWVDSNPLTRRIHCRFTRPVFMLSACFTLNNKEVHCWLMRPAARSL